MTEVLYIGQIVKHSRLATMKMFCADYVTLFTTRYESEYILVEDDSCRNVVGTRGVNESTTEGYKCDTIMSLRSRLQNFNTRQNVINGIISIVSGLYERNCNIL